MAASLDISLLAIPIHSTSALFGGNIRGCEFGKSSQAGRELSEKGISLECVRYHYAIRVRPRKAISEPWLSTPYLPPCTYTRAYRVFVKIPAVRNYWRPGIRLSTINLDR